MFQFQNGAIKSKKDTHLKAAIESFNSKMVRLKATAVLNMYARANSFNSKMVRLKGEFAV